MFEQQRRMQRRIMTLEAHALRGLPVGSPAPAFSLRSTTGETVTQEALLADRKPILLFFIEPDCGPCKSSLPQLIQWQREHADRVTMAFIGRNAERIAQSDEFTEIAVLVQNDREVAQSFKVVGSPAAVLIRSNGKVGAPVAAGYEAIRRLVHEVTQAPASR